VTDAGLHPPVPGHPAAPSPARDRQWLLSLLPLFPLVLLVLRLWTLAGQDLPTMLLLVQHVSPVGPVSALVITLLWVFPVVVLVTGALGALLRASDGDPLRSRLGRASARTPDWVLLLAGLVAVVTWQLRFLPALLMLALMITGLLAWIRHGGWVWRILALVLPVVVGIAEYVWFGGAIAAAARAGEAVTTLLLVVPPVVTLALTGPVPAVAARPVTARTALFAALLAPFVVGALFLRTPVLPSIAVEVERAGGGAPDVVRGFVVDVDDTTTTLLDEQGVVRFLPNRRVRSRTLCPGPGDPPASVVDAHGWPVEQTLLGWVAPAPRRPVEDPRCRGRPLP
jgi:hypothetical protein